MLRARVDSKHREIADSLIAFGCSVQSLHKVGNGCPDLLVGYRGREYLLEVKSKGCKAKPNQQEWHRTWKGSFVRVVYTMEEAARAVGLEIS